MNIKMTTNSQLSDLKNKTKLSKQLEQEQSHRHGDHLEGYQWEGGKAQKFISIIGRYKIDRGWLRTV